MVTVRGGRGGGRGGGGGSAPEANRGRPLAELAFATLSREEQSEEARNVFGTPRWEFVYTEERPFVGLLVAN